MDRARFSRRSTRRLAQRALTRGLSPRAGRRLDQTLAASEQDRQAYGRLVELFRVLEGDPPLTEGQHRRILSAVQASVAGRPSAGRAWLWLHRLSPALALGLLLVVMLPLLPLPSGGSSAPGLLSPRGAHPGAVVHPGEGGSVALEIHCLRDGRVVPPPPRVGPHTPEARCHLGDELQLTVSHTAGFSHLLVIGRRLDGPRRGALQWYYPLPPTGRAGPAPRGVRHEPLGQALTLAVNHAPGRVRVVAVFAREPLSAELVGAWLEAHGDGPGAAAMLDRLGGGTQVSAVERTLQITPEGNTP